MILADPQWFCLTTNPNCQTRAELKLAALGYRTFAPKIRKWASHARVRKAVHRPLLGRYVFVEVDQSDASTQSFGEVKGVDGVESMIAICGQPIAIPRHWVEGFIRRYLAGEWDEIAKNPMPLGARVRIMEGEWMDLLATITKVKGSIVTCKILGTNQHTRLHKITVRPWAGEAEGLRECVA